MRLIIAEKPSVAQSLAAVLGAGQRREGYLEGGGWLVSWCVGHLAELADAAAYDPAYAKWRKEDLPILPEHWRFTISPDKRDQFDTLRTLLRREDVAEVVNACDAGREGELIFRTVYALAGCSKPISRLWISSMEDEAIREGFAHLRPGREYDGLHQAALCRSKADWLVGINATRALTCKYNAQLSCGRVQTPTLAMIAKREAQIRAFVPQPYFGLQARKDGLVLTWQDAGTGSHRSFDRGRMEGLAQELKGETAVVAEVKRTPKKTQPPLLYDLTELQRDANKRFNYSAKDTLNIMQRLYENHKVLTYPRTDSRYLSADIVPTLKERLKACSVGPYKTLAGRLVNQPLPAKPFFVDNSKVSDHHAIIPTEQYVQMDHMTIDERRIYDLVVRRFLAVLYPPFEYDETSLEANIRGQRFIAKGRIVKSQGWKAAYDTAVDDGEEEDEPEVKDQQLPDLKKGDVLNGLSLKMTEGKTKPPAPFNEATLLSAMENPVAYMETKDKAMAKTLGETGGLGTVATRADIIEKLFSSFLLEKRGKDICLTSKARQLLELVPEDLKKPELTADWEMKLSGIAKGSLKRGAFMKDIRGYSQELIRQIKTGEGSFRHDNLTNTKCPVCGKRMLAVKGKNTEMLVCQDRECGHREVISRTSNARCPVCHKKMELKGKGDAQIFVCRCGHKEKLKAFEERRKKEGAGVTKKDVARYLNQQKKEAEEPVNNAFAKALAGLNLKDKG